MSVKRIAQPCRGYRQEICLLAAGALSAAEAAGVESHLGACQACRDYFRQIQAVSLGVQELGQSDAEPSPGFDRRWREAVAGSAVRPTPREWLWLLVSWLRLAWAANRPALVGLAAVWMATVVLRFTTPQIVDARPLRPPLPPPSVILSVLRQQERLLQPPSQTSRRQTPQPISPRPWRQRTGVLGWSTTA